jgi:hypothetical protein
MSDLSDVKDIVIVGGIVYLAYHLFFKQNSVAAGVTNVFSVPTENEVIEWQKTGVPENISPIYQAGFSTGEWLGKIQQNLTVGWAKLKGSLGITW